MQGCLEDNSEPGRKAWRSGMERLAECENVVTKLSAFGTFIHCNDPDFIADMTPRPSRSSVPRRCMFGSNFPIEKIWTSYADLFAAFRAATADLPDEDRQAIFHDTAARVYRI